MAFSNTVHHFWRMHLGLQCALDLAVNYLQAVWVQEVAEVTFLGRWVLASEEAVVETNLCIDARVALYPVDGRFGLAVAALGT